ncbi:MAG TPA: hypothetical protein VMV94_07580 [Phycisphaerae bacterium]|nr:hypothetical protein [Phycisphaerae bacterium]
MTPKLVFPARLARWGQACCLAAVACCTCSPTPQAPRPAITISQGEGWLNLDKLHANLARVAYLDVVLLAHASMLAAQGEQAVLAAASKRLDRENCLPSAVPGGSTTPADPYIVGLWQNLNSHTLQAEDKLLDVTGAPLVAIVSCFWASGEPPVPRGSSESGDTQAAMAFYLRPSCRADGNTVELVLKGRLPAQSQSWPEVEVVSARLVPEEEAMEFRSKATKLNCGQ